MADRRASFKAPLLPTLGWLVVVVFFFPFSSLFLSKPVSAWLAAKLAFKTLFVSFSWCPVRPCVSSLVPETPLSRLSRVPKTGWGALLWAWGPPNCPSGGGTVLPVFRQRLFPLWWQGQILLATCSRGSAWGWFQHGNKELPPPAPKTSPQTLETPSPFPRHRQAATKSEAASAAQVFEVQKLQGMQRSLLAVLAAPLIKGSF